MASETGEFVWSIEYWLAFTALIIVLLAADLFLIHKKDSAPSFRESALWTVFWCSLAFAFNAVIAYGVSMQKGIEFMSGYLVEWSLSMDNVFVFAVIFKAFRIPLKNQYRILFWGILGAIVLRFVFVILGSELISHFQGAMSVFGVFLIYTGIKVCMQKEDDLDPEQTLFVRIAKRFLPIASHGDGQHFTVRKDGKLYFTPLFLVLVAVESTDVLFAVDSVPAVFGVTRDPFIVFTSNIFAILGLRSLYFMLAGFMDVFKYLHYGLSAILVFVGTKMNLDYWFPKPDGHHWFGPGESLGVIVGILVFTVLLSLVLRPKAK